jgi:hypothetical protein
MLTVAYLTTDRTLIDNVPGQEILTLLDSDCVSNDMALKVFFQLYNRWNVVKIELYAIFEVKLQDTGSSSAD